MKSTRRYVTHLVLGMIGYALGLIAMNRLQSEELLPNYLLILLPIIPLIWVAASVIRFVRELDEMWRKIVTESFAFSGIATGFTCISFLFVSDKGLAVFQPEWAFYMMWLYYGLAWFG